MNIQPRPELMPYQFGEIQIDSFVDLEGMAWFHGLQTCEILGFSNPSVAIPQHTDDDERQKIDIGTLHDAWFVSEPGLYGLTIASKKLIAKKFKRWIKHDVLPSIRKRGGYISPDATREQLTNLQSDITTRLSAFESAYSLCKDQGDERGMLFIKDQVQNLADKLNHLDSDIPQDWLSVSEILEQRGYSLTKPIRNSLSQIGKNVKKDYESDTGLAVKVTTKAVGSGHKSDEIKVYPPNWHDRIEQVAVSYWQSRDIIYHNKLQLSSI